MMRIEPLRALPAEKLETEIVERKGIGHPDTICDCVAEEVSQALCAAYLDCAGRVLHHNADKALLIAGVSSPRLGGGEVVRPMRLILGDRATARWGTRRIPVHRIARDAAHRWIASHLRFVDPNEHVRVESALHPGSAQLTGLFDEPRAGANDTSVGVGYAPLTETERLVLLAEETVNGRAFKERFPEAGEDVKVMAVRTGRDVELTLAVAMVDRFLASRSAYFERKAAMREALLELLRPRLEHLDSLELVVNALDREEAGARGMYLTVLGTSAEGGDGGGVGRGNRVNGLISLHRPMSLEAAAGKNPWSHTGKIYNLLAHRMATEAHATIEGLEEVRVYLCSRIGHPIEEPWMATSQVALAEGVALGDVKEELLELFERRLAGVPEFLGHLVREGTAVC